MARMRYSHNTFNTGIISKKVQGNTSFEGYNNALDECVNFQVQHTGGLFKRGGSYFIAETRNSNAAKLVSFAYSADQSYICEFGELPVAEQTPTDFGYIRFYTKYGAIKRYNSDDILELRTPFTLTIVNSMKHYQQGNTMYFVTSKGTYYLERNSAAGVAGEETFSFFPTPIEYTLQPLTFINNDPIALKPSAVGTGGAAITITAINPVDPASKPDAKYAPLFFNSDINNYLVLTYIGNTPDDFIHYYLKITSVTDDTGGFKQLACTIDAKWSPINDQGASVLPNIDPVTNWRISAFSANRGFPSAVAIYEGRQFLANNKPSYPLGVWGSSTFFDDFFNFLVGSNAGDAVQVKASTDSADEILWMTAQSKLFIGTRGGIYIAGSATYNDEAITPENFRMRLFESTGASNLQPLTVMDAVFFVDTAGKNVHEIVLAETGAFQAHDLSLLANDLTQSGIIDHTWQQTPVKTYWCATNEGHLCALTYLKNNNIIAWTKHIIAGKSARILSLAAIHEDRNDIVWMVVQRDINGTIKRFIEYIHPMYDPLGQEEFKQFYVDSGIIKEQKHTIQNITKSENTRIICDMTPIRKTSGYKHEYLLCFHINLPGGADSLLGRVDIFSARNITNDGADIHHDTRFINADITSKKIDPLDYDGYVFDVNNNIGMYYMVSNITSFIDSQTHFRRETFIGCDNSELTNNDTILIQNSGIQLAGGGYVDYTYDRQIFRVEKTAGGLYLKNLDSSHVATLPGTLNPRAELFKRVNQVTACNLGTNTLIELKKAIPDNLLSKIIGNLNSLAYNGNNIVAVSSAGVAYIGSDNGTNWIQSTTTGMGNLTAIAYGNGYFVAVNNNPTGRAWRSNDNGQTWTQSATASLGILTAIAYGGGYFVAVDSRGVATYSNNNGQNWIQSTTTGMGTLTGIAFGVSYFMAVSSEGRVWMSNNNGQTWTVSTTTGMGNLTAIAYGGSFFVAVNSIGEAWRCPYSSDSWTRSPTAINMGNLSAIAFISGSTFIAVNRDGKVWKTTDAGQTWTHLFTTTGIGNLSAVTRGRDVFVTTGKNGAVWQGYEDGSGLKKIMQINDVYINKVVGMTEINQLRYLIRWISNDRKQLILYDYKKSPAIPQNNLAVIDSSEYSLYDTLVENNGNCYLYFDTVEGLDHLNGLKVSVCADGNNAQPKTVAPLGNNKFGFKLDNPAMYCCAGLEEKAYFKTVPFSGGSVLGSSDGVVGNQKDIAVYFYHSLGGRYGAETRETYAVPNQKKKASLFDAPQNLFTGLIKIPMPNAQDIYSRTIYFEHSEPLSCNILSIAHDIQVTDA